MTLSRSPFNGFTIQGDLLNNLDHSFSSAWAADKLFAFHRWGHSLVTQIGGFLWSPQARHETSGVLLGLFGFVFDWGELCGDSQTAPLGLHIRGATLPDLGEPLVGLQKLVKGESSGAC